MVRLGGGNQASAGISKMAPIAAECVPLRSPIQTRPVHQLHGNCGTCNAKTNAREVDAKFAAEIVTDEPVENEAGPQQHTSSAGGAGDVAGYGPNNHV